MAKIEEETVSEALERSIRNAKHLRSVHSASVAAARMAARRLDELDANGWEIDGKLDNVTLPTFLKYMDTLGLTPGVSGKQAAPAAGPKPRNELAEMRKKLRGAG